MVLRVIDVLMANLVSIFIYSIRFLWSCIVLGLGRLGVLGRALLLFHYFLNHRLWRYCSWHNKSGQPGISSSTYCHRHLAGAIRAIVESHRPIFLKLWLSLMWYSFSIFLKIPVLMRIQHIMNWKENRCRNPHTSWISHHHYELPNKTWQMYK